MSRPRETAKEAVGSPLRVRLNGMENGCCGFRGPGSPGASGGQGGGGAARKASVRCAGLSLTLGALGRCDGSDGAPGVPWGWKETCIPAVHDLKGRSQKAESLSRIWKKGGAGLSRKGKGVGAGKSRVLILALFLSCCVTLSELMDPFGRELSHL